MRWFSQFVMRLRMLFSRNRAEAELEAELHYHLERQVAENMAAGMSPQQARSAALRGFGNPGLLRDPAHATWNWSGIESLLRDLRRGARSLRRTPGFTLIAVGVMALGIGANVALFTVVRSVLLKPLPFKDADHLLGLGENTSEQFPYNGIAGGIFAAWQEQNRSFSQIALLSEDDYNLSTSGDQLPEKVRGLSCSWNMLSTLGVSPALGRDFTAVDDRPSSTATALLTWGLWKRRFGGDKSIVNQTIHINGQPYTVIGVLPSWFYYSDPQIQIWTPIHHDKPQHLFTQVDDHMFGGVGRLKPGVSQAQAQADLSVITRRIHDQHLDDPFVSKAAATKPLLEDMVGDLKRPLFILLAATGCVLLIACLNVANLLVARAAARRKDLAVRMALGGGRLRLLRERLLESLLLSAAGGAGGLLLASAAVQWLVQIRHDMSRVEAIHIDAVVVLFTVGIIVACALLAGLVSALSTQDRRLLATLQDSARGSSSGHAHARVRVTLLAAEVGLTVILLVAAGLLVKSYQRLRASDLGCLTENVLTMRLDLFGGRYNEPAKLVNFYRNLLERVRAIPGVTAAGFARAVPGQGYWGDQAFTIVEHPPLPQGKGMFAINREADPGFFAAMGIPLLRGQTFDASRQLADARQVVVSASFARIFFPGEDPIGKHLHYSGKDWEICGVVGDTRFAQAQDPQPIQYYSLYAGDLNNGTLVIRSHGDVEQFALPVQRILASIDPSLPVSNVLTMDQLLGKSAVSESFNATLLAGFAVLSLVLAAAGLFGVLSYIVSQRTSEIGIRIALGARREQVMGNVLLDGLRPALVGLALGLGISAALVSSMESMLYKTPPLDASVFGTIGLLLLLVSVLACLAPAWRASRLDPMQALRTE